MGSQELRRAGFFSRKDRGGYPDWQMMEELLKANANMKKDIPSQSKTKNMEDIKSVVARFECNSAIPPAEGNTTTRTDFNAVYNSNGVNASFSKATPWGQIVMGIDQSTPAHTFFKRGKTYKVTFEEVEDGQ